MIPALVMINQLVCSPVYDQSSRLVYDQPFDDQSGLWSVQMMIIDQSSWGSVQMMAIDQSVEDQLDDIIDR
jgi:hypothetical protein